MASVSSGDSITDRISSTVEIIWQMALASLPINDNELLLTKQMFATLQQAEVEEIKSRMIIHLNISAVTIIFDSERQVFRFVSGTGGSDRAIGDAASTPVSHLSTSPSSCSEEHIPSWKIRAHGKKSKVPRPPNSFILYRQKWHPILKQENPDMHNNDISVIIGKKWKAEPEHVKAEFKGLAEERKKQHERAYPSYHYMPRKPSEKKRRMTARKRMQITESDTNSESAIHELSDFPEIGSYDPGVGSSTQASFILPEPYHALQWDLGQHNSELPENTNLPFLPPHREGVVTTIQDQTQTEQALFDSMVDWDAIQADVQMIASMVEAERAEWDAVEPDMTPAESRAKKVAEWEAELARTLHLFE